MAVTSVGKIADAIKSITDLVAQRLKGTDKRKLRKATDYADKAFKRYRDITNKDERDEKIEKYIKKFYDVIT